MKGEFELIPSRRRGDVIPKGKVSDLGVVNSDENQESILSRQRRKLEEIEMTLSGQDFYMRLGVKPSATEQKIKEAFEKYLFLSIQIINLMSSKAFMILYAGYYPKQEVH